MQIKIYAKKNNNYESGMGNANLDEYRQIYPKSIKINSDDLNIDEIIEISELYDQSILKFEFIKIEIKSKCRFYHIKMLANIAKKVNLTISAATLNKIK